MGENRIQKGKVWEDLSRQDLTSTKGTWTFDPSVKAKHLILRTMLRNVGSRLSISEAIAHPFFTEEALDHRRHMPWCTVPDGPDDDALCRDQERNHEQAFVDY